MNNATEMDAVAGAAGPAFDPLYVAARAVLLDGLEALREQRRSVVLVGAQAVYLRVGAGDLATTPHTTDADLAFDPALLRPQPPLDHALSDAGLIAKIGSDGPIVGSWVAERTVAGQPVLIDLDVLVPDAVGGVGRRAARLPGHGGVTARKAVGLELALVDNDEMDVRSLDPVDERTYRVRVAGVAALLVAKVHKVAERLDDPRRNQEIAKDALDVLRVLRGSDIAEIARVLTAARTGGLPVNSRSDDDRAALTAAITATTESALVALRGDFAGAGSRGALLAGRAASGRDDPAIVAASLAAYVNRLLDAVTTRTG